MGIYLNPNNALLQQGLRSEIYVDKSLLLAKLNALIGTENKYLCVSRSRRFGKTITYNNEASFQSAIVIELKNNKSAETAIQQIKERKYDDLLGHYRGEMLLVGVNYDEKTKKHECKIEKLNVKETAE